MSISSNDLSGTINSGFNSGGNTFQIGFIIHTSNNLINQDTYNSNILFNYSSNNSNNLSDFIKNTSYNLTSSTSNNSNSSNFLFNYSLSNSNNLATYVLNNSNNLATYILNNSNYFSNISSTNSNNLANYTSNISSSNSNNLANYTSNISSTNSNNLVNYTSNISSSNSNNLANYTSNISSTNSNNLANYVLNNSNIFNTRLANLNINTDTITQGSSNRFIVNDIYNRNITFTNNLISSNITTSNLNVIGDSTVLNTTIYQTEQLQVVNDTTSTALIVKQVNINKNVGEFYYQNNQLGLIINSNGNIGIGITNPLNKLDVSGNINTGQLTILTTINNPLYITSTNVSANNSINIKNNSTFNAFIGLGGTGIGGNYANNFFIESSSSSIIFNTNGRTSASTPNMIINSTGNVGIGTLTANNIFQIGNAGRLRIANDINDYTLIGTLDTDGTTNTRIVLSGNTRASFPGNIDYIATSTGTHKFMVNTTSQALTILSNGNIGIGVVTPTCPLSLNITGFKCISIYDNGLTNNFQFVGFGASNGLCFNNYSTSDAFQFRAGTSTTAANELMRINGNGSVCIGTVTATSANTKLTISGTSTGYSQPLVNITQIGAWDGNYALQVSGYTNLGGFRINGADGNSIYHTTVNANMGFSLNPSNTSGNITYMTFGSSGNIIFYTQGANERMKIDPNGIITTSSNIDCGGGIALTGSTGFINTGSTDAGNLTNTYINFKYAGTGNDWCYLRQIGGDNAFKLAFDFHDDTDARFCIRCIESTANPDNITEVFTVDNGTVTCTGNLGVGTTNPPVKFYVNGDIAATGDITAYYSDIRLKNIHSNIENPLDIINNLNGFYYTPNDLANSLGIKKNKMEIGLSAQDVQKVLPELINIAPFDMELDNDGNIKSKSGNNYLTISYERLVPVLIEGIKEQNKKLINLENELNKIKTLLKIID